MGHAGGRTIRGPTVAHAGVPPIGLTATSGIFDIDTGGEIERIAAAIRSEVLGRLRKRGVVVALSGGIDSSLVAALCARAVGSDRVLGLLMPERDSSPEALSLGHVAAAFAGIDHVVEDIEPALTAIGCYERQVEAIRSVCPEYGDGWRSKLVIPSILDHDRLSLTLLVIEDPDGEQRSVRLPAPQYLQLVAATGFKQQLRKTLDYYHAGRLNYAVAGTPNRLEYDLGFFVRHGDGASDILPIAHLYKTQVYVLAEHLGLPHDILSRPPTTDTFSMPQTQQEFYFALSYPKMDAVLWAWHRGIAAAEAAELVELTAEQVERVYRDIDGKRRVSEYLHYVPQPLVL